MKRRKILYVITKSVWGGAQRYVYDLATNLPKDQFDVIVAAGGSGPLFVKLQNEGIQTIAILGLQRDVQIVKEVRFLWHLFNIFIRERPDIIHLNSTKVGIMGAPLVFLYKLIYQQWQATVIFTVHGWGFMEPRPHWQRAAIFFLSWLSSFFQDTIIIINTVERTMTKSFIPSKKLAFVSLGISPTAHLPREEARTLLSRLAKATIDNHTILIGTIAELTKNKGIQYLVDAMAQIKKEERKNMQVIIIGEGEERKPLTQQIARRKLKNTFHLAGFLNNAAQYLPGFDIFVLPSAKEGLPYTVMEAMAASLPSVASRVGGVPNLITHGKNGFLAAPRNSPQIAATLAHLSQNAKLRATLGENAKEKILTRFPLQKMIQKTAALYARYD